MQMLSRGNTRTRMTVQFLIGLVLIVFALAAPWDVMTAQVLEIFSGGRSTASALNQVTTMLPLFRLCIISCACTLWFNVGLDLRDRTETKSRVPLSHARKSMN